jgi:hypothetical protein
MGLDLYRILQGLNIETPAGQDGSVLVGNGAPGGDTSYQDAAKLGSIYMRNDAAGNNLQVYFKCQDTNSVADWKVIASKDYVDAIAQGLSWRVPARVLDATAYADSAAFPTTGTINGVTLADGDRALFTNVAASGESNVWIWDATGTSWSEDSHPETDGDAILVTEGTSAETQWVYDGTNWVLFNSAAGNAELGYLRAFIGKATAGNVMPTYSSTTNVSQSSNLQTAVGALDAAVGSRAAYTEQNYITNGQAVAASLDALDVALKNVADQDLVVSATNVDASGTVTLDSIPVAQATQSKWLVQVRENTTPANRRGLEVHSFTDGTTADYTQYGILKLGALIAGFGLAVDVSGGNLRLRLTANNPVDYVVKRLGYTAF